jgi:heme A synthase
MAGIGVLILVVILLVMLIVGLVISYGTSSPDEDKLKYINYVMIAGVVASVLAAILGGWQILTGKRLKTCMEPEKKDKDK